jgi:hypothetical protein
MAVLPGDPPGRNACAWIRGLLGDRSKLIVVAQSGKLAPGNFERLLRASMPDCEKKLRVMDAGGSGLAAAVNSAERNRLYRPGQALQVFCDRELGERFTHEVKSGQLKFDPTVIQVLPSDVPRDDLKGILTAAKGDDLAALHRVLDPHVFSSPEGVGEYKSALFDGPADPDDALFSSVVSSGPPPKPKKKNEGIVEPTLDSQAIDEAPDKMVSLQAAEKRWPDAVPMMDRDLPQGAGNITLFVTPVGDLVANVRGSGQYFWSQDAGAWIPGTKPGQTRADQGKHRRRWAVWNFHDNNLSATEAQTPQEALEHFFDTSRGGEKLSRFRPTVGNHPVHWEWSDWDVYDVSTPQKLAAVALEIGNQFINRGDAPEDFASHWEPEFGQVPPSVMDQLTARFDAAGPDGADELDAWCPHCHYVGYPNLVGEPCPVCADEGRRTVMTAMPDRNETLVREFWTDIAPSKEVGVLMVHDLLRAVMGDRDFESLEYLGSGRNGSAYRTPEGPVLKVTTDMAEVGSAMRLIGRRLTHIHEVYRVAPIGDPPGRLYAILQEGGLGEVPASYREELDLACAIVEAAGASRSLQCGDEDDLLARLAEFPDDEMAEFAAGVLDMFSVPGMMLEARQFGLRIDLHGGNVRLRDGFPVLVDLGTVGDDPESESEGNGVPPDQGDRLSEYGTGSPGSGANGPPTMRSSNSSSWSCGVGALKQPQNHVPTDDNATEDDLALDTDIVGGGLDWGPGRRNGSSY